MKEKSGRGMLHPVAFINNTFNYLYIPTNIIITSALASLAVSHNIVVALA